MPTPLSKQKFMSLLVKQNERFANINDPFSESVLHDEDLFESIVKVVDDLYGSPSIKNIQTCADWFNSDTIPKYRVVLEEADCNTSVTKRPDGRLVYNDVNDMCNTHYHVHIVSNEKANHRELGEKDGEIYFVSKLRSLEKYNRVVASTDTDTGLPSPSEYFLRSYCKDPNLTIERVGIDSSLVEIDFKFSKTEEEPKVKKSASSGLIDVLNQIESEGRSHVYIGGKLYFKKGKHPYGSDWSLEKEMIPVHKDWLCI